MVCDMEITPQGAIKGYRVLSGGHAFARAPHLHAGVGSGCRMRRKAQGRRRRSALLPHLQNLYALYHVARGGARQARRDRLRHRRARDRVRRPWQDHAHRSRAAQRRAQADRGMHAGGQRLRRGLPRRAQAAALYRVHEGPPPDKLAALREFLATSALQLARRRRADAPPTTRSCSTPCASRAGLRPAADRAAALAVAGAVPARQRRPLRPRLRGVHALHVADPPLSRPARASRDQGRARGQALHAVGHDVGATRRAHVDDRAPRRRRVARRHQLAQVPLHAGPESARNSTARSAA